MVWFEHAIYRVVVHARRNARSGRRPRANSPAGWTARESAAESRADGTISSVGASRRVEIAEPRSPSEAAVDRRRGGCRLARHAPGDEADRRHVDARRVEGHPRASRCDSPSDDERARRPQRSKSSAAAATERKRSEPPAGTTSVTERRPLLIALVFNARSDARNPLATEIAFVILSGASRSDAQSKDKRSLVEERAPTVLRLRRYAPPLRMTRVDLKAK